MLWGVYNKVNNNPSFSGYKYYTDKVYKVARDFYLNFIRTYLLIYSCQLKLYSTENVLVRKVSMQVFLLYHVTEWVTKNIYLSKIVYSITQLCSTVLQESVATLSGHLPYGEDVHDRRDEPEGKQGDFEIL